MIAFNAPFCCGAYLERRFISGRRVSPASIDNVLAREPKPCVPKSSVYLDGSTASLFFRTNYLLDQRWCVILSNYCTELVWQ